jgi:hypothetical protein
MQAFSNWPPSGWWAWARTIFTLPNCSLAQLVAEMASKDLKFAERDELIKQHGHKAMDYHE